MSSETLQALPIVTGPTSRLETCVASEVVYRSAALQVVHWDCQHDGEALRAERSHTTYVLSIVHKGMCTAHDGSWDVLLDSSTALLHRPGAAYRTMHPHGCIDSGWSVAFRRDLAEDILERCGALHGSWDRPSALLSSGPARARLDRFIAVERARHGQAVDPLFMDELWLQLLADIAVQRPDASLTMRRATTGRMHRNLVDRAREYLHVHAQDAVQLEDVARAVGASTFHLCRVFKIWTGCSIHEYLKQLRLTATLEALASGKQPLSRIAVENGFYSHSHFSTVFARELGCSPRDVRRSISPK